ncbi:MAG: hypothetical protein QM758_29370 [Armatimonas sp.]
MTLGQRLQRIDRRWLYLVTALIIGVPFIPGARIPVPAPVVQPQTIAYHKAIEDMAADPVESKKLVIMSVNYAAGTLAENQSQCEATMKHLMKKKLKFALFSFTDPQGRDLSLRLAQRLAPEYNYKYGEDWCSFGFRPSSGIDQTVKTMSNDLLGGIVTDVNRAPIGSLPMMKTVKSADEVGMVIHFASSDSLDIWLQYFARPDKSALPVLYAPTSIMAPQAYPLLRSGQLKGMLTGLKGAIEYEALLKEPGFATNASASLSWAHFLIILLVVMGNVGMYLEKKRV